MSTIEVNPNKEYILAGDISASMRTEDELCSGTSRYKYMLEKFKQFIKTAEDFDPHGACVLLFGEKVHCYEDTTLEKVEQNLKNIEFEGFTNLHLVIDAAYDLHRQKKREFANENKIHPGTLLIIFTDGEPTNRAAVERSIVAIANQLDKEDEFQIILLTVGKCDKELQAYLDNLHDSLENKIKQDYDILHIDKLENVSFLGAVTLKDHA